MFFSSKITAVLLAGSVSLAALCGAANAAPFTYSDMVKLDRINGFKVDSSGRYAVLNIRATDMDKNKGVSSLWLKDLSQPATPEVKLAISEGGASNAQWSPDGKSIYFLSSRGEGGSTQVWKTDITGAKAVQVTRLPLDVGAYQVTPDGKGLVLSLAVFPECKGNEISCTVQKQDARKADKSSGEVYTKLFVRHWDTWADGTRNHLFYVPLDGASPIALTDGYDGDVPSMPFGDEADYTISPDSKTVWFSAREAGKTEPWSTNFDIYSVPLTGGAIANHTKDNPAWDGSPRLSPDGKTLAYVAMKRPGFEADRFGIMLKDENGKTTALAPGWDRSVAGIQWSQDGKSLLVDADDVGKHILFRVDVKTGKVTPLTKGGHTNAYAETPRGFVFLQDSLKRPSTFYQAKAGAAVLDDGATNLTRFNSVLDTLTTGAYEQFSFKGWNNEEVHGYVVKPAGYVEGQTYPVAFLVHGGPQGSFGDGWSYRWNPETYAGAGYAVVMIDFHGSTGYGQAFTDAISEHWGDRPLEDLQKGWAFALDKYKFLDGNRACALGASYGGYMINWIAGNWKQPQGTKGWKCLVEHDGIFDTRTMAEETEELWFSEWENGGAPYDKMAKMDAFNPALHAKDWSVPQLVIHSDKDYRVVPGQGIATFTALQRQGIELAFLRFPDENHWVLKPQNSMKWHKTVFDWMDKYTAPGAK
ncbi:Dipeptidyl-peptidase 5 [Asticcacaulis sp. MM231]|uniref:dipeptidyl-peptidase 5 n=1 Tax=Asticcacaulis sp. MM231 TaxID=3157666 RepID=UPI0032D58CC2